MNGIEALEQALESPFDLYLVDINMPKLNGYGFREGAASPGDSAAAGHHGLD